MNRVLSAFVVDDDKVSRILIEKFVAQTDFLELKGSFSNAEEALVALQQEDIDLLFLDVEMPKISGMEMLKSLKIRPHVVLITSNREYALEAFEHHVTDYLLKPSEYTRFLKAATHIREEVEADLNALAGENPDFLFVKHNGRHVKIRTADIKWVEAIGDYVEIHTVGQKQYVIHATMKVMEKKLGRPDFIRVHRSYIVRIDQIEEIEDGTIVIVGKFIPIGKSYKKQLLDAINMI
ncbi:MAG: LytTR family DNA-binding domain-containing protein [Bacteroidetes bacterium]|jgi:DNA-binding LytR/AlgR family response regulator|nr:LytTR family DNA-binding domain-containing protein [Bacteroidota bacterium]